ncbi:GNAT family N-acetyltransferase, partial [Xanthomonas perforans]
MSAHARPQIVTLDPATDAAALRALRPSCATDTAGDTSGVEWDALDPLCLHLAARTADRPLTCSAR